MTNLDYLCRRLWGPFHLVPIFRHQFGHLRSLFDGNDQPRNLVHTKQCRTPHRLCQRSRPPQTLREICRANARVRKARPTHQSNLWRRRNKLTVDIARRPGAYSLARPTGVFSAGTYRRRIGGALHFGFSAGVLVGGSNRALRRRASAESPLRRVHAGAERLPLAGRTRVNELAR